MGAAEFRRIEALVIVRILQQAIDMNAGFMGEYRFADDALVRRDRASRRASDQRRNSTTRDGATTASQPWAALPPGPRLNA